LNGDETPKATKLMSFLKKKENSHIYKEDVSEKEQQNLSFLIKKPQRKTSVELEEGKERLRKLFSSKKKQTDETKKETSFKEKKILIENKDFDNSKNISELKMAKLYKENKKAKENAGFSGAQKHKRQLSNTLLKPKKTLN